MGACRVNGTNCQHPDSRSRLRAQLLACHDHATCDSAHRGSVMNETRRRLEPQGVWQWRPPLDIE